MTTSIYTFAEQTVKTRSVKQAYEYAAIMIRHLKGPSISASTPVYPAGTYDSSDNTPVYTLEEFSEVVNAIVYEYA